jgi:Flp pilus assembly protein TadG
MKVSTDHNWLSSLSVKVAARQSGQALFELALLVPLLCLVMFAIVDYGRVLNDEQIMVNLSRQGSNMASRGATLSSAANSVVQGSAPLNLATAGQVTITSVARVANSDTITGQVTVTSGTSIPSKIGTGVGNKATVPAVVDDIFVKNSSQTVYITEVYYPFQQITPLARMWNLVVPPTLYQVAYF